MKTRTKKVIAGILAVGFVVLDKFGSQLFINKVNKNVQSQIISHLDLKNRNILAERYVKYNNNDIKERERVGASNLDLDEEWVEGKWYVEEHRASHFHHDLSIIANGKVYRLARTPSQGNTKLGFLGLFPGPKEKSSWTIQPEHYVHEVPNPSVIDDGYGAGTSKVVAKGSCLVRMSENGNLEAIFDKFEGVYAFIEKDNSALIIRKFTEGPDLGGKHKMKDGDNSRLFEYINDDEYYFVSKYDGSAVEWIVESKGGVKYLRVYSWRPDKKLYKIYGVENQIDHTYRLLLCSEKLPPAFPICKGRAELYVPGKNGFSKLSPILNSLTYNSRLNPDNRHIRLIVHDIKSFEGIPSADNLPYEDKLVLFERLEGIDSRFTSPFYASSKAGKERLWNKLLPKDGYDGVIIWKRGQIIRPIKMKFKHEDEFTHQGYIVRFEPQTGQHGDKFVYPIIQNEEGIEFKIAGKGLTHIVKADMFSNPEKYIGKRVYYSAEKHFDGSGLPFQPVLKEIL